MSIVTAIRATYHADALDTIALLVSVLLAGYLLYALVRGEEL
jgi:K+-transporting ATPase KdpF subunit